MDTKFMEAVQGDLKLELFYDADAESPREFVHGECGTSVLLTWHRHYDSPDENQFDTPQEFLAWWHGGWWVVESADVTEGVEGPFATDSEAWECAGQCERNDYRHDASYTVRHFDGAGKDGVLLNVFMYDHSGVVYRAGATNPFHCPWDSGQVGFIYSTAEQIAEWGVDRESVAGYLAEEVDVFSRWASGEFFGAVVSERVHVHATERRSKLGKTALTSREYDEWEVTDSVWGMDYEDPREGVRQNLSVPDALVEALDYV